MILLSWFIKSVILEVKTTNQKVIGVTRTNGKKLAIGGNLGIPVLDLERDAEIYVIEFSSFQLELLIDMPTGTPVRDAEIHTFFPGSQCRATWMTKGVTGITKIDIAILLNITPDHVDRHGNMKNYIATKLELINSSEIAVIGCDNEITADVLNKFIGNKIPISDTYFPVSFQRVTLKSRKEKPLSVTQMVEGSTRNLISLI
ncbi:Mur ligase middle domain protein, partial [Dictyocaulus viviparus]